MEVQNTTSGQTTVNWTSTTAFSKTVTEAVSSLAAGDCVSVTGTPSKKSKTTIAARSITVTTASSSGSCTSFSRTGGTSAGAAGQGGGFRFRGGSGGGPGFGGGSGTEGGGSFQGRPAGGSGSGSSNFRKELASLAIGSGKVKSVKGSTLTVSGYDVSPGQFTRPTTKSGSKTKKPATPKTETLTITTSKSTTVSSTQSAAASALAVGDCVSAFGPAAANGAVTATTVRITSTGGGTCTSGFGAVVVSEAVPDSAPVAADSSVDRVAAVPKASAGWGRAGHRRAVLIGGLVLVVVLGGGVAAWAEVGNGSAGYREATVTKADIGTSMTVVGNVDPVSDAAASFQVSGQVATVAVTPGQQVTAGQTLGTLQTTALSEAGLVGRVHARRRPGEARRGRGERVSRVLVLVLVVGGQDAELVDDHHDDRPHSCEQRTERHGHAGPDHADPGRVNAVDRPEQGGGRPGAGPERLHQCQHRHPGGSGHLRGRPPDRLV